MKLRTLIAGAIAAIAIGVTGAADAKTVVVEKNHKVIVMKGHPRYIARNRVIEVVRARHIRFVGQPYMYRGYYVLRCYDRFGRVAFCKVHPRTGAFLGITVRL